MRRALSVCTTRDQRSRCREAPASGTQGFERDALVARRDELSFDARRLTHCFDMLREALAAQRLQLTQVWHAARGALQRPE